MTILNLLGGSQALRQKAKRIRVVIGIPVYIVSQRLGGCLGTAVSPTLAGMIHDGATGFSACFLGWTPNLQAGDTPLTTVSWVWE